MDLKEKLSDLLIDEYQIDVVKDEWKYQKIVNSYPFQKLSYTHFQ